MGVPHYTYSIMGPQNPILIIKAPNIEPYYRSPIDSFKGPLRALYIQEPYPNYEGPYSYVSGSEALNSLLQLKNPPRDPNTPLIKEYTLNHNIQAPIIQGRFLN